MLSYQSILHGIDLKEGSCKQESDSQISPVEEEKVAVLQSFSDGPPIAYGEGHDEEEDPDRGRDEPLQGDEKTREVQVQVSSHAVMHLIASGKPLAGIPYPHRSFSLQSHPTRAILSLAA